MRSKLQLAGTMLLAVALVQRVTPAAGQDPAPTPSPTPQPSPQPPIAASVDRYVDRVLKAHENPCERADRQGVPCFPVTVEAEGPRFSVADALRRYRADGRSAPGPPTTAEARQHLTGAQRSASGGVSGDPGCIAKSLVRVIKGGSNSFYLYRVYDGHDQHPLLTDREIDPKTFASNPLVSYEPLGKFTGECDAVAAWRKALREAASPETPPR